MRHAIRSKSCSVPATCVAATILAFWAFDALAALDCPSPPAQVTQETRLEIEGELGTFKRILGGSGKAQYEQKANEIFSRYPNADKIVITNFLISVFCQLLNDSTQLSDKDKFEQLFAFSEQVARSSGSEGDEKYPPNAQISALKSAFKGKDPEVVRVSIGRALDSPSAFIQNMGLRALLGGVKSVYSGDLIYKGKSSPFLMKIGDFNELDGTFTGEFAGWDEKFQGQLSGTTVTLVGEGYTFSVSLSSGTVLEGDAWQGCIRGVPGRYCGDYDATRIWLF